MDARTHALNALHHIASCTGLNLMLLLIENFSPTRFDFLQTVATTMNYAKIVFFPFVSVRKKLKKLEKIVFINTHNGKSKSGKVHNLFIMEIQANESKSETPWLFCDFCVYASRVPRRPFARRCVIRVLLRYDYAQFNCGIALAKDGSFVAHY